MSHSVVNPAMTFKLKLQMWMNALKTLTGVITMQLVTTLKGVTPALATVDMQEMDLRAIVSSLVLVNY